MPWKTNYDVNAATPVVMGDKLFVTSGYGRGHCALLQVTDTDRLRETIQRGIGSGKGLGFGLLSLARPNPFQIR